MNIIQAKIANPFGDGYGKKYIFKVPDGVEIIKNALLLAERNSGKDGTQVVRAATDSAEVTDEVLDMIMDGKKVISSIIGVYELKELRSEEPEEQEVDWSKVAVDTPILVKSSLDEEWHNRYFAKYKYGDVYAWGYGGTSWSALPENNVFKWEYAKLAEVEE